MPLLHLEQGAFGQRQVRQERNQTLFAAIGRKHHCITTSEQLIVQDGNRDTNLYPTRPSNRGRLHKHR